MRRLLVLLGVAAMAVPARAQLATDAAFNGLPAAAFLEIGVGARAESLGGAYAAEAGRLESLYWNPAGIAFADGVVAGATHTEWLAETDVDFAGLVVPTGFNGVTLGASLSTAGVPEQPVRTVDQPDGTGQSYDARSFALGLTVAGRPIPSFSVGVTAKLVHERLWDVSAQQVAFDVGVRYETPVPGFALGASVSNFGADLQLSGRDLADVVDPDPTNQGATNIPVDYRTDGFGLPQLFRFGVAYARPLGELGSVRTVLDLQHPTGATESVNVGIEYGFRDLFFVRGGYQSLFEEDEENRGLSLGAGLGLTLPDRQRLVLDYSWSEWGRLGDAHRFSVAVAL